MSIVSPSFSGTTQIEASGPVFLERFKERVQNGLLMGKPHWRSRYEVTNQSANELAFRAATLMTAINVGLNDVALRTNGEHQVAYSVTYRRWAAYAVVFCAALGLTLAAAFFLWDMESWISRYPIAADPELNRQLSVVFFWGSVVFWGFIWPWILIAMHRAQAKKFLNRLIQEVDRQAV